MMNNLLKAILLCCICLALFYNSYSQSLQSSATRRSIEKGYLYIDNGNYRLARQAFQEALRTVSSDDNKQLAKIYTGLGNASKSLSEYPEALNLYLKALSFATKTNNPWFKAGIHANLAQLFQLTEDLDQALIHLKAGFKLIQSKKRSAEYLVMLHTMANIYGMRNQLDSALLLDREGLAIARAMKRPDHESPFLDNKANCFMYGGQPDSARYYFNLCLEIDKKIGNIKQQSDTWLNLGTLAQMNKQPDSAKKYLKVAVSLAEKAGYKTGKMQALKVLSAVYREDRNFEEALNTQLAYYNLKDSINNEKKDAAVAEWKAVFDTQQKEQEIRLQQVQLERKNMLIYSLIAVAALTLLTIYLWAKRNQIRKEKVHREQVYQQEQKAAADVINAEETERRRVAVELHDGVGQTMTAAWLNLQAISTSIAIDETNTALLNTTTQLVQDSCSEIREISHNMIPDVLLSRGLIPALKAFTAKIAKTGLSICVSANDWPDKLNKIQELMLYRVIQECVQNTLKHAAATELDISLNCEENSISVLVEDNGRGFNSEAVTPESGIGIHSIRSRVTYLKGTAEWSSSAAGSGTLVAIYIPVA
jgi:two-component system NarL family sensor kinase